MQNEVTIAGAGIAGLSAALCLARNNINSVIYEARYHAKEAGAGLQISPNASQILSEIGVLSQCLELAFQPHNINLLDGKNLQKISYLPIREYVAENNLSPYFAIHRADLHAILYQACLDNDLITIINNSKIVSYKKINQERPYFEINFSDNSTKYSDILIAANGVWSNLRSDSAKFTNYIAWRSLIKEQDFQQLDLAKKFSFDKNVHNFLGACGHIVIYPIRKNNLYNIVAISKSSEAAKNWHNIGDKAQLLQYYANWHNDIKTCLDAAEQYHYWPLYQMPKTELINQDNVIFIGDASHAILPFSAQGAAMAIEDSFFAANAISSYREHNDIKKLSELNQRKARIAKVKKRGSLNELAYHANFATAPIRNIIFKLSKPKNLLNDLDWLYKYRI